MLSLNKVLGISEKLEQFHADYRDGNISEKELNIRQNPDLAKDQPFEGVRSTGKGPDTEEARYGREPHSETKELTSRCSR